MKSSSAARRGVAVRALSPVQEALWSLDRHAPGSPLGNLPAALRLRGSLDVPALAAAFGEIARRHQVLRAAFRSADGRPRQVIARRAAVDLPRVDLRALPPARREAAAAGIAAGEGRRPFELARGPLVRLALAVLGGGEHLALLTFHRIVADGASIAVFAGELASLYGAFAAGRPSPLAPLTVQYADLAERRRARLKGGALRGQLAYWRARLAGAPAALALPTDRPRPPVASDRGGAKPLAVPAAAAAGLRELGREAGATLFMTLLAAFATLLGRYTGQEDLILGSPVARRDDPDAAGLIGPFADTLALRADLVGDPTFRELLARVRQSALGAYAHPDVPFERLAHELASPAAGRRPPGSAPLVHTFFALASAPAARELPALGLRMEAVEAPPAAAWLDLAMELAEEGGGGIGGRTVYRRDLFDGATIERLLSGWGTLVAGILGRPQARLSELPLLAAAERGQLLAERNDSAAPAPVQLAHEMLAARAARRPDLVALVCGEERLSFGEWNVRSNRLAHRLRALGAGRDVPIGLLVERSLDLAVGLLGIWKSGGAFLPLDPGQPAARLGALLADSAAPLVIGEGRLLDALGGHLGAARALAVDGAELARESACDPLPEATPASLAQLVYPAGSAGRPRGVSVEHAGLASQVEASLAELGWVYDDVMAVAAPVSSGAFFFELLSPLAAGGRAILVPLPPALDVEGLLALLPDLTRLHAAPALLRRLAAAARRRGVRARRLRTFFVDDGVPPDLAAEMRQAFPAAEIRVLQGHAEIAAPLPCLIHA